MITEGLTGMSNYSKSPIKQINETNQVIKPKVDESVESMHIVTLDFQGVHHPSFVMPPQHPPATTETEFTAPNRSITNEPSALNRQVRQIRNSTCPPHSSVSCEGCTDCMINMQSMSVPNQTCSCSGCGASHTYAPSLTDDQQVAMSTRICLETTLYEADYVQCLTNLLAHSNNDMANSEQ